MELQTRKKCWIFVGVLLVGLSPLTASDQEALWIVKTRAGQKAFQQARLAEAERLFLDALKEAEESGPETLRLATSLDNLAKTYLRQARYAEAESLYKRALGIQQKVLGPDNPWDETSLSLRS